MAMCGVEVKGTLERAQGPGKAGSHGGGQGTL